MPNDLTQAGIGHIRYQPLRIVAMLRIVDA